ncbi:D-glycero-alpha-D-manno-heptose-1,7-bisphosphate 7-phosphatase [Alkaliphilus peptidifermentans]|uniref:D,D-heptose 1,7-bisphosphate phosphatase n=1 Tax=Alkaliphilus peptidifermentans DSM 18978 TaxID=1120976 RepID=A0A1G5HTH7_9FIRM|nr:HAD-IIIA family hydrolase [Alkaliphilus peptidifermentans]SCY67057.1 D-glycero-D-manno-heptose 1,7-bisphosphate phosphatase [Alkaliphilus peptidifermentans DSM 18978]
MKKGIFFDRDGVLNDNVKKHVNKPEDLVLYEGVTEALKEASSAGYKIFIVTNQGGIELGHLTHEALGKIHECLRDQLSGYCEIEDIEYCPDFKKPSKYRKPEAGMILKLAEKHNIDLSQSWMVGDRDTDITAGIKAGCNTAKIGAIDERANINELMLERNKERKVDLEAVVSAIIIAE